MWHWFEWFPSKQVELQHKSKLLYKLSFPLVLLLVLFFVFIAILTKIPLIFLVSWWVLFTPEESRNKFVILHTAVCRNTDPASWMPIKKNALGCIFSLEYCSLCEKDYSCYNISQSDWTSNFFFSLMCCLIFWMLICCSKYFPSIHFTDPKKGDHVLRKAKF